MSGFTSNIHGLLLRKGKHLKKYLIHRETDVVLTVEKTKNCSGGKVNT